MASMALLVALSSETCDTAWVRRRILPVLVLSFTKIDVVVMVNGTVPARLPVWSIFALAALLPVIGVSARGLLSCAVCRQSGVSPSWHEAQGLTARIRTHSLRLAALISLIVFVSSCGGLQSLKLGMNRNGATMVPLRSVDLTILLCVFCGMLSWQLYALREAVREYTRTGLQDGRLGEAERGMLSRRSSSGHRHFAVPGASADVVAEVTTTLVHKGPAEPCTICCEHFEDGESLRVLPCLHRYHTHCIDQWLERSRTCPVCKRDIME